MATPVLKPYVVPVTIVILAVLFFFQSRGTAGIGVVLGPVTLIWFLTIAGLGVAKILKRPGVLMAVSPHHAVGRLWTNGYTGTAARQDRLIEGAQCAGEGTESNRLEALLLDPQNC